jgi:hypothetical protein
MNHPSRLGHLVTRAVAAAKLRPTYAENHHIDEDEAQDRLERALRGHLWEVLLDATWAALNEKKRPQDEAAVLERVAEKLKDRPLKPGRPWKMTPPASAFMVLIDLEAGVASDAARKVLESAEGERMTTAGIAEAGRQLAHELTR